MIQTLNLPRRSSEKANDQSEVLVSSENRKDHSEGLVARAIEQETAKMPSDAFLWAALGTIGLSLALYATRKKSPSLLVGQWAAPLLILGVYNKLVKVAGSDRVHKLMT